MKKKMRKRLAGFNISNEAYEFIDKYGADKLIKLLKEQPKHNYFERKFENWLLQAPAEFIQMARRAYLPRFEDEAPMTRRDEVECLAYELTFYDIDDVEEPKLYKWRSQAPRIINILDDVAGEYEQACYPVKELYKSYMSEIEEVFSYAGLL